MTYQEGFMKYLFLLILLTSCADLQKNTNVNMMAEAESVKILDSEGAAASCKFVTNVKGEDNLLNMGKETAISNMKRYADGKEANALWVQDCKETQTAVANIVVCTGKAYKC
jgi:hypothetical protein